jgi:hypothetical protein
MQAVDITNKRCDKAKVLINRKLAGLVNAHEGLWRKIGELARTPDYCLIETYEERILAELSVIEKEIGICKDTEEIRDLIFSLSPDKAPVESNLSEA